MIITSSYFWAIEVFKSQLFSLFLYLVFCNFFQSHFPYFHWYHFLMRNAQQQWQLWSLEPLSGGFHLFFFQVFAEKLAKRISVNVSRGIIGICFFCTMLALIMFCFNRMKTLTNLPLLSDCITQERNQCNFCAHHLNSNIIEGDEMKQMVFFLFSEIFVETNSHTGCLIVKSAN